MPLRRSWNSARLAVIFAGAASVAAAQTPSRLATNVDALVGSPVFFHGRQIAIRGTVEEQRGLAALAGAPRPIFVFWSTRPAGARDGEIRGEFWDVGRLQRDDPRFSGIDLDRVVAETSNGVWPGRDQVFVIVSASFVEAPLPAEPSIRAIALAPEHYADRGVTVTGRFRGNNLYGDVPQPIGKSKWDFVLQSADGAVWVSGVRPRGKGFDLDPDARVDTNRWLQVAGTVRHAGRATWIDATSVALTTAPTETAVEVSVPVAPSQPPPEIVFTAPVADDTGVAVDAAVRIQFSRDMDPDTIPARVHVSYVGAAPPGANETPPAFTVRYLSGAHGIEIRFSAPLARFRQVKVELTDGILSAVDHQPLQPWSMTFTTGG